MKNALKIIGATDYVDLPELGWHHVPVRVDSGAATSAIHCSKVKLVKDDAGALLEFQLDYRNGAPPRIFAVRDFKETVVRNSFGKEEKRYVIKTRIEIFGKKIKTEFSLANRRKMQYPILLGRKLLKNRFIVDVAQKDLSATRTNLRSDSHTG